MATINDFVIETNKIPFVPDSEYEKATNIINTLDAVARMTPVGLYVTDYYKKNFFYVSENTFLLGGDSSKKIKEMGYTFYLQHVPETEIDMLMEISRAGFDFCARIPVNDRTKYTISSHFHIVNENYRMLVNHKLTPLFLAPNGNVWLAVCAVSLSSHQKGGYVEAYKTNENIYWKYSLENHQWKKRERLKLNGRERDILLLSVQGYTMNEIAKRLFLSVDTIKFHKRVLFERLGVNNITEAVSYISNQYPIINANNSR